MKRKDKRTLVRIIIAIPLLAAAWILAELLPLNDLIRFSAFMPAYIVIGWDVLYRALRGCIGGQIFDENLLMALATIGALATGEYPEAVAVMLFYQVGELFERIAVGRSRRSIAALMDICPDIAVVERDGTTCDVSPDEVEVGEIIVIRTGDRIPLDGIVVTGSSSLDTAALTGESMPRAVTVGDEIAAGCINREGLLRVRVSRPFSQSTVTRILELVESASERKATTEQFITRFARWYTPCVVLAAAILAIIPPICFGAPWQDWLHRAMVFLVISCPCALVISVPLSFFVGIGRASRRGILVKGGNYLEALADTDTVVFDKTGTLTEGRFSVREVHATDAFEGNLLELAALAEAHSLHPIAQSLRDAYDSTPDTAQIASVEELSGRGVRAIVDGRTILAGNAQLMTEAGIAVSVEATAGTTVYLAVDGQYAGYIVVADTVKPSAKEAIRTLHTLGIKRRVMLTGDTPETAADIAGQLGIHEYRASLLPDGKVTCVEELLSAPNRRKKLAFVGDGINDAPVLARADVGIAMGGIGSDAAIEAADIVLMDDDPLKIAEAIRLARRTRTIVQQNIIFALAVKGAVLLLGAFGHASMWAAVFADVGVSVLAILNAMR